MSVLDGYPRRGREAYRCRDCGGELHAFSRFATFPAKELETVTAAAKHQPRRIAVTPPKNKDGIAKVDFFPRSPAKCCTVTVCTSCGKRRHGDPLSRDLYYQTTVRGVRLWASNRSELVELRAYIARRADRRQGYHKLPATILKAANRDLVLSRIDELLATS